MANPEVGYTTIVDRQSGQKYRKGKLLGKGGFAKCYEMYDSSNAVFAGKIVESKGMKSQNKEKLTQEINIHRGLNHQHIVKFYRHFQEGDCVYILLELCTCKSLLELHKCRKTITEPETRYFSKQIANACHYLHENKIIHRDLKLANIFLNDDMIVKLGDFGLATKLDHISERKKTMCGTPNYIAPEVLRKEGHSFEVDSWSLGCIIFTLLVGKPPFETESLRETYSKIRKNEYQIPFNLSGAAHEVIRELLDDDASRRPSMARLLKYKFYDDFTPRTLPKSAMTTAPRFDNIPNQQHQPFNNIGNTIEVPIVSGMGVRGANHNEILPGPEEQNATDHLVSLHKQIADAVQKAKRINARSGVSMLDLMDESEDPMCSPIFWISKWVDYSDRYGIGYQMSDGSTGVVFNDVTRLIMAANNQNIQYIEKCGIEYLHTMSNYPQSLHKKITLLNYFRSYMAENLMTAGATIKLAETEAMVRLPYVQAWFRTKSAIVLYLSNGTLQINIFNDHTKIILCPLLSAVTYIDGTRAFRTFRLELLQQLGMTYEMFQRLDYGLKMIEKLLANGTDGRLNIKENENI